MNNSYNPTSIKDRLKETWYRYNKYIILSVCLIAVLIVTIILLRPKESKLTKYSNIERIMILNAQNYVKNNNIEGNIYISLNNLNIKIDDKIKCNTLSGVYKENDDYYPYLICEKYMSQSIKEIEKENELAKEYAVLNGDNPLIVDETSYQEDGVKVNNEKYQVNIKGNDIDNGLNIVTYYINDNGKNIGEIKRIVIAEELEGSYPVLTLIGEKTKTIPQGSKYTEQGYKAIDEYDGNVTDKVIVTGNVDTNKPGTYKLTYSVTNSRKKESKETRTIIVNESADVDLDISHILNPSVVTRENVTITVTIKGNGYKYTILPDNSKKESSEMTYTVYKNGTYDFIVYDKNNNSEVYSVKVSNINKEPPKGTCVVNYENGKSVVSIKPEEPSFISKYQIYNNDELLVTQKEEKYEFNKYPIETKVKLVDIENKSRVIKCEIKSKGKVYTSVNFKNFKWKYYYPGTGPAAAYYKNTISYAIWAPEDIKDLNGVRLPIMIWLHGSAETYDKVNKAEIYLNRSLVKEVTEWDKYNLEPIPAIIIAPQAPSVSTHWSNYNIYESIRAMVKYVKDTYNSPTDSIALIGHSMGGGGALLINDNMKKFFRTVVPMSCCCGFIGSKETYTNIRIKGFDENCDAQRFYNWMGHGSDFTCLAGMDHVAVFYYVISLDKDKNGASDLIEWMFEEYYNNYPGNTK